VRQVGVRVHVCGCRGCVRTGAREVLGDKPQRVGRDANTTSRPRRGVAAHGKAVAWHGKAGGAARPGGGAARLGRARPQGAGVHARGSRPSRAAAWPCRARGTDIPGPRHDTAAEGNGGYGSLGGATGS
jgi:hypothetical protein